MRFLFIFGLQNTSKINPNFTPYHPPRRFSPKSKNLRIHRRVSSKWRWGSPEFNKKKAWRNQKTNLETTCDFWLHFWRKYHPKCTPKWTPKPSVGWGKLALTTFGPPFFIFNRFWMVWERQGAIWESWEPILGVPGTILLPPGSILELTGTPFWNLPNPRPQLLWGPSSVLTPMGPEKRAWIEHWSSPQAKAHLKLKLTSS